MLDSRNIRQLCPGTSDDIVILAVRSLYVLALRDSRPSFPSIFTSNYAFWAI